MQAHSAITGRAQVWLVQRLHAWSGTAARSLCPCGSRQPSYECLPCPSAALGAEGVSILSSNMAACRLQAV